jgi:hypothetical protein
MSGVNTVMLFDGLWPDRRDGEVVQQIGQELPWVDRPDIARRRSN